MRYRALSSISNCVLRLYLVYENSKWESVRYIEDGEMQRQVSSLDMEKANYQRQMNYDIQQATQRLVLSHMFGYLEQKLLGRSRKSLVFLKSNFFGSEKIQVSAHVLPK
jgi:hypothetical protein